MELGKVMKYDIRIFPSHNKGFVIEIGCGRFVAENIVSLLHQLKEYLLNPKYWGEEYKKSDVHSAPDYIPSLQHENRGSPAPKLTE